MSKHRTSENSLTSTLAATELSERRGIGNCVVVIAKKNLQKGEAFKIEIVIN